MKYYRIKNLKLNLYWTNNGWVNTGNLYGTIEKAATQIQKGKLGRLLMDHIKQYQKPAPPLGIVKSYIDQYDPADIAIVSFEVNEEQIEQRIQL